MSLLGIKVDPQMTASGYGPTFNVQSLGNPMCSLDMVVANINTSVTMRVDQSSSPTFASDIIKGPETTYNFNGTYQIPYQTTKPYVRAFFVSEVGGTTVTVDCTHRAYAN
jgi:hypothetical protein